MIVKRHPSIKRRNDSLTTHKMIPKLKQRETTKTKQIKLFNVKNPLGRYFNVGEESSESFYFLSFYFQII